MSEIAFRFTKFFALSNSCLKRELYLSKRLSDFQSFMNWSVFLPFVTVTCILPFLLPAGSFTIGLECLRFCFFSTLLLTTCTVTFLRVDAVLGGLVGVYGLWIGFGIDVVFLLGDLRSSIKLSNRQPSLFLNFFKGLMYILTKVELDNQPTLATISSTDMPSSSAFVEADALVEWTENSPKPAALK